GRAGADWRDRRGRSPYAPRREGAFPPRAPRVGLAGAPLSPGTKLARRAREPAREIVILAIALCHPALLERHGEELAAVDFAGRGLAALRDALVAAPSEALQSPEALAETLQAAGKGEERERILALAARMPNWWCVGAKAAITDADHVLRQSLALHRRAGS